MAVLPDTSDDQQYVEELPDGLRLDPDPEDAVKVLREALNAAGLALTELRVEENEVPQTIGAPLPLIILGDVSAQMAMRLAAVIKRGAEE